ncbi:MAG: hypothetical protein LIO90_02935 [Bacteroidales bacterium]|nr:hypothetical protein [Bacteroidales bacterium]
MEKETADLSQLSKEQLIELLKSRREKLGLDLKEKIQRGTSLWRETRELHQNWYKTRNQIFSSFVQLENFEHDVLSPEVPSYMRAEYLAVVDNIRASHNDVGADVIASYQRVKEQIEKVEKLRLEPIMSEAMVSRLIPEEISYYTTIFIEACEYKRRKTDFWKMLYAMPSILDFYKTVAAAGQTESAVHYCLFFISTLLKGLPRHAIPSTGIEEYNDLLAAYTTFIQANDPTLSGDIRQATS